MNLLTLQFLRWLIMPRQLVVVGLCLGIMGSAISVAYSAHLTRNHYAELQALTKDHDDLEHEYERLLLEQSAWADYTRLDQLAEQHLTMVAPGPDEMVVVQ